VKLVVLKTRMIATADAEKCLDDIYIYSDTVPQRHGQTDKQ